MNSFDARVRYTRRVLQEAFLKTLESKSVAQITVKELCEQAQLNRATFYKHYLDVPDLFEKTEAQHLQILRQMLQKGGIQELDRMLIGVLEYMKGEGRPFLILGSKRADPYLGDKIFQMCYEMWYPMMEAKLLHIPQEKRRYLYQFISHGSGAVLSLWVRDGMEAPVETVVQTILEISHSAVKKYRA